jgi:hypothetical protein
MNRSSSFSVIAFVLAGLFPFSLGITRIESSSQQPESKGPAATSGDELSAEQILERYTNALGGQKVIEKIKSRSMKGATEYTGSAERAAASLEYYWKTPDKTLAIQKASFGDIKRGFNGSQAWAVHPSNSSQARILGDDQIRGNRVELAIYYRPQALKTLYSKLVIEGRKGIDGHNTLVVAGEVGNGKIDKFYFDIGSFLLFRLESWIGDKIQDTLSFSDYKEVDGMKVPFTTQLQRPNSYLSVKFSEVKHNTAIEDSIFDPPGSR